MRCCLAVLVAIVAQSTSAALTTEIRFPITLASPPLDGRVSFSFNAGLGPSASWRVDYVETDLGQRFTAPSEVLRQFTHAMHAFPVHGGYNWAMGAGNASYGKGAQFYGFPIGINGPRTSEFGDVVQFSGPDGGLGPNFQIVGISMGLSPWIQQPDEKWLATQSLDISWDPTPEPGAAALASFAALGLGTIGRHRRLSVRRS